LHTPGARPARRVSGLDLGLVTPDREQSCVPALLRAWLLEQARTHLVPWLLREAERVGRAPSRVQVRLQRTRWGSCSSRGGISLNAGLLFLEAELVRYLLIHELCHLEVMNHSRRFWARVRRFEPDCRRLDRRLAESWADIPWWTHELM
jgi:predicted metal-dependent hydrolase